MRCAIYGCSSDNSKKVKDSPLRFYRFPSNENVRKKWISSCCRADKFNPDIARVCSKHFLESDFLRNLQHEFLNYTPKSGPKLKADVVPSVNLPKGKIVESGRTTRRKLYCESSESVSKILLKRYVEQCQII